MVSRKSRKTGYDWTEYYRKRKTLGLCRYCSNPPAGGLNTCARCSESRKAYQKQRLKQRAKDGLCSTCDNAVVAGKKQCAGCLAADSGKMAAFRARRAETKKCVDCGKPSLPGRKVCDAHREKGRLRSRRVRAERRKQGLCEECAKCPPIMSQNRPVKRVCETCYLKATAVHHFKSGKRWKELKAIFNNSPCCPFLGIKLTLGVNTALDHIIPRKHGGPNEPSNLRWVFSSGDIDINMMRGSITDDVFLRMVRKIYKHANKEARCESPGDRI